MGSSLPVFNFEEAAQMMKLNVSTILFTNERREHIEATLQFESECGHYYNVVKVDA